MPDHDFSALVDQFPNVIASMPETFTSHQFFLELARRNQTAYVDALYSYRNRKHRSAPAPFQIVHGILAKKLLNFPELIEKVRDSAPGVDIFGQSQSSALWHKLIG